MQYSREVEEMYCVAKGAKHDPAPIPEEGKWGSVIPAHEVCRLGYDHIKYSVKQRQKDQYYC